MVLRRRDCRSANPCGDDAERFGPAGGFVILDEPQSPMKKTAENEARHEIDARQGV